MVCTRVLFLGGLRHTSCMDHQNVCEKPFQKKVLPAVWTTKMWARHTTTAAAFPKSNKFAFRVVVADPCLKKAKLSARKTFAIIYFLINFMKLRKNLSPLPPFFVLPERFRKIQDLDRFRTCIDLGFRQIFLGVR